MNSRTTPMSFLVAVAASLAMLLPGNSAALEKSSGCDSPTAFSAGSSVSRTIQPATARDGRYTIYLPSAYDQNEPMPLVIGLHGWTSSGASALRGSVFSKTAESYGLVTAWPDGVNYPQAGRGWAFPGCNASPPVGEVDAFGRRAVCEVGDTYNCDSSSCPSASAMDACAESGFDFSPGTTTGTVCEETQVTCAMDGSNCNWCGCVDDEAFIRAVVDDIMANACIDRHRVYLTGMSAGGMMTSWLYSRTGDVFAAFAPIAGPNPRDFRGLPAPVDANASILYLHGTGDTWVRHDGLMSSDGYYYEAVWSEIGHIARHLYGTDCPAIPAAGAPPTGGKWSDWAVADAIQAPAGAGLACRTVDCAAPGSDSRELVYCLWSGGHNWPKASGKREAALWGNRLMVGFFLDHCNETGNRCTTDYIPPDGGGGGPPGGGKGCNPKKDPDCSK